ncbi:MAG: hypothetical protein JNK05_32725 [Myxococcales bacterium]|nr:hypothetical protein [Myxococcales bacterium]
MLLGEGRRRAANSRHHREQTRVAAHIARAEKFAHENKTAAESLDPLRSLVRALLLDALREYREDGVFPENHRRPYNTPVFVDEKGTHCAVGHLLALSGHGALVEKIASERNLATVHELSNEPELVAWLDATGLTLEEATLIQPGYQPACSSAQMCFCRPYTPATGFGPGVQATVQPASAVLDGTLVAPSTVRVERIYGTTTGHVVGETLSIGAFLGAQGSRVLVPVHANGGQPGQWNHGVDAGVAAYVGIGVSGDGTASCTGYGTNSPPVPFSAPAQLVIDALRSDCYATFARVDPTSTQQRCGGCACTTPSRALREAPSHAALSILLSLVTALVVRRSRRRDRQRPR